jgi:hypothetical protein
VGEFEQRRQAEEKGFEEEERDGNAKPLGKNKELFENCCFKTQPCLVPHC